MSTKNADPPSTGSSSPGRFPIVCVGASAGGVEALQAFTAALPADLAACVVVVLHLPGDAPSQLAELLAANCALPVRFIEDGTPCAPGEVQVLPPGYSVAFEGEHLRLADRPPDERWRPVDRLFTSLADEVGDCAVAVVLSGTGTNGSVALGRLRAAGALVLAQDPAEAEFKDMPRNALATGHVERAAPCAELARIIVDWGVCLPSLIEERERATDTIDQILAFVRAHTGRDFRSYKPGTIERRIQRRAGMCRCRRLADYCSLLREDEQEIENLARDLLIGVTAFFRDPATWQVLDEVILPQLIADADEAEPFRAWVGGCASGEEAYSLAILVHEARTCCRGRRRCSCGNP